MHFWMASADRAHDCLSRLSSVADFLHLQVIEIRILNFHIPLTVIMCMQTSTRACIPNARIRQLALCCVGRLTSKACSTGWLPLQRAPLSRHRTLRSISLTAWGG